VGRLFIHPADLRALQPEPGHQPLLIEEDRVDLILNGAGSERLRGARVEDDDTRADAELKRRTTFTGGRTRPNFGAYDFRIAT